MLLLQKIENTYKVFRDFVKEVALMARVCDVCGKDRMFGNKVTFSNKKNNRSWKPNIRRVRAIVNGSVQRINVCTRCLRSGYVERAL